MNIYKARSTGDKILDELVQLYNNTGRLAFVYPRKKKISFNGGQSLDYKQARQHIYEFVASITTNA